MDLFARFFKAANLQRKKKIPLYLALNLNSNYCNNDKYQSPPVASTRVVRMNLPALLKTRHSFISFKFNSVYLWAAHNKCCLGYQDCKHRS